MATPTSSTTSAVSNQARRLSQRRQHQQRHHALVVAPVEDLVDALSAAHEQRRHEHGRQDGQQGIGRESAPSRPPPVVAEEYPPPRQPQADRRQPHAACQQIEDLPQHAPRKLGQRMPVGQPGHAAQHAGRIGIMAVERAQAPFEERVQHQPWRHEDRQRHDGHDQCVPPAAPTPDGRQHGEACRRIDHHALGVGQSEEAAEHSECPSATPRLACIAENAKPQRNHEGHEQVLGQRERREGHERWIERHHQRHHPRATRRDRRPPAAREPIHQQRAGPGQQGVDELHRMENPLGIVHAQEGGNDQQRIRGVVRRVGIGDVAGQGCGLEQIARLVAENVRDLDTVVRIDTM
jgi:hypothetical protein